MVGLSLPHPASSIFGSSRRSPITNISIACSRQMAGYNDNFGMARPWLHDSNRTNRSGRHCPQSTWKSYRNFGTASSTSTYFLFQVYEETQRGTTNVDPHDGHGRIFKNQHENGESNQCRTTRKKKDWKSIGNTDRRARLNQITAKSRIATTGIQLEQISLYSDSEDTFWGGRECRGRTVASLLEQAAFPNYKPHQSFFNPAMAQTCPSRAILGQPGIEGFDWCIPSSMARTVGGGRG